MASLPPDLTNEALALSPAEKRAYSRWYTDLLLRRRGESVAVGDVLAFVNNFGLKEADKQHILSILGGPYAALEPPQFYAFLRMAGHVLQGKQLRRELAYMAAPVPRPKSILATRGSGRQATGVGSSVDKHSMGVQRDNAGTDMDSFMSLMTGKPSSSSGRTSAGRPKKRVTFDSRPPQVAEAAQRSMEELMRQKQRAPIQVVSMSQPPAIVMTTPDEDEPEVALPTNNFASARIDSILHDGTSSLPQPPAPRKLVPNHTGPAQLLQMGLLQSDQSLSSLATVKELWPQSTGGPYGSSGVSPQPVDSGYQNTLQQQPTQYGVTMPTTQQLSLAYQSNFSQTPQHQTQPASVYTGGLASQPAGLAVPAKRQMTGSTTGTSLSNMVAMFAPGGGAPSMLLPQPAPEAPAPMAQPFMQHVARNSAYASGTTPGVPQLNQQAAYLHPDVSAGTQPFTFPRGSYNPSPSLSPAGTGQNGSVDSVLRRPTGNEFLTAVAGQAPPPPPSRGSNAPPASSPWSVPATASSSPYRQANQNPNVFGTQSMRESLDQYGQYF